MKTLMIIKRDGRAVPFDARKIEEAVDAAYSEANAESINFDLQCRCSPEYPGREIANSVLCQIFDSEDDRFHVERIQDLVEKALMRIDPNTAKAYILYRANRATARAEEDVRPNPMAIAEYIHASKYARYLPEIQRREVYEETVARVELMHLRRFQQIPEMRDEIVAAFDLVRERRVLPSMRTLQFGGHAVMTNHARGYNCAATLIDRPRVFAETMFLLLSGTGTGYSVQTQHVAKLPEVLRIDRKKVRHYLIEDTIEGWADAVGALARAYFESGEYVEFSYHLVRKAGSPLKTSGGRAPGHLQLKTALERVRGVFERAAGRRLSPFEAHSVQCHIADAVLSGGIRRSAMIALFSLDDDEMLQSKSNAEWFTTAPWLANANNSVVLKRDVVTIEDFTRVVASTREWGEPGFFFVDDYDDATNPCAEILLQPTLEIDGEKHTGWAMCNLTIINAAKMESEDDFLAAARAATLIGTLQATYTVFPYLGPITEAIVRRDALLGVSMTGMQDSPAIALDPVIQRRVAAHIQQWNAEFASRLGIRSARGTTCIKPEGTSSLAVGGVGSGIHPHHSERYIRRVTADEYEVVFQAYRAANPRACVKKPDGKWVIEFAVRAPEGATLRADLGAIAFLEQVRSTQENWVQTGTARGTAHHNVSNTVTVRDEEWEVVTAYLYRFRHALTGVSLLSDLGDTVWPFVPFEEVRTEAQKARWVELATSHVPVDYLGMLEAEDGTSLAAEAACAGGKCEVR